MGAGLTLAAYDKGDYATALREITYLAGRGYSSAQNNLGLMYDTGKGVQQNRETAVRWYTRAAEQKNIEAQYYIGLL